MKKVAMPAGANKMAEDLAKRGYEPVLVPYSTISDMTGSGTHSSTCALWREYD